MCGIVGYIGKKKIGLDNLLLNAYFNEYRGDDGIGILYTQDGKTNVEKLLYKLSEVNTEKLDEVKVFNVPDLQEAKNVLVVDDIVDSGDTLIEVLKVLESTYPSVTFYTAALFYKKSAKIAPTWFIKEPKGWIEFFWSEDINRNI